MLSFFSVMSLLPAAVSFTAPTPGIILCLAFAVLLLLVSGFVSGSEIAFFSLSPTDLVSLDADKSNADREIEQLRTDGEHTLATILIVNNLVNVTIIMLLNYVLARMVSFGEESRWLQFLFTTVVLTFLLLLFGEIMPKIYSRERALAFCRFGAPYIAFLSKVFHPFSSLLVKSGSVAQKVMHGHGHVLSVDALEQALELTDTEEIKDEKRMLEGIIRFGAETAKEVMTSRQDIVDLDITSRFDEVLQSILENNYSRIPVYKNNTDNIRGFLYVKDLLPHLSKGPAFRWQSLIRPAYFVPETKKIDDLLREFQANKIHMAIVVDEFGGTSGLITLEDILEEIVGEINDEFDDDDKFFTKVNNNTYVFEGKTLLADFCRTLNISDEAFADIEGDADTLAGLILEIKGDFPELHERFDYDRYTFEVLGITDRRISSVKVIVHN